MAAKRWDELTPAGKFRRLRPLALAALEQYNVAPGRLRFVGGFTNAIFRVDSPTGIYAIRIDYMQDHPDASTVVELAWLAALAEDTELDVAKVVASRRGELSVYAAAPGVPGERRCVLFEWIPGKPLDEDMTPSRYRQLGAISAALHLHGAGFVPPLRPMAWNQVFYWPADVDPVVYNLPENAARIGKRRMKLIERSIALIEPAFARLDPAATQIIHGDVHPWNVHVSRSRMFVLDFEDVLWGHRVQDIATTLFYGRSLPQYPGLRVAFEEGYRTVADWPVNYDGELEHFMAARTVMFINYVLNIGGNDDFHEIAFPRLSGYLDVWE